MTSAGSPFDDHLNVGVFLVDAFVALQNMLKTSRDEGRVLDAVEHEGRLRLWLPMAIDQLACLLSTGGFRVVEQHVQRPAIFALLERFRDGDESIASQHLAAHYLCVLLEVMGVHASAHVAEPTIGECYSVEFVLNGNTVVLRATAI